MTATEHAAKVVALLREALDHLGSIRTEEPLQLYYRDVCNYALRDMAQKLTDSFRLEAS